MSIRCFLAALPLLVIARVGLAGSCPNWITFSPDGRYVAVSNSGSDDCSIIDTNTRREMARIKVGKGPKRLLAVRTDANGG